MRKLLCTLDLFSGIGGFSLGLERTGGFKTVAFCEIEPFPRAVLAKHWPEVPCYDDVRTLTAERLAADGISIDVICGGFPCQDISQAGSRRGLEGARSGLWFEFLRLVDEIHPPFVIIENVTRLRAHGLEVILGGLAEIRYDAEWHCLPAAAFGAPDIRDRLWIIAYPQHPDTHGERPHQAAIDQQRSPELLNQQVCVAGPLLQAFPRRDEGMESGAGRDWYPEPGIRRVADRTALGVHRLKALGNAVKPCTPELIGRAILETLAA